MKNKVLVIGADHHNTLGIVESLGQKGLNSYVLIVGENINSFVLKSRYVIEVGYAHHQNKWLMKC